MKTQKISVQQESQNLELVYDNDDFKIDNIKGLQLKNKSGVDLSQFDKALGFTNNERQIKKDAPMFLNQGTLEQFVDNKIPDISNLATKDELNLKADKTEILWKKDDDKSITPVSSITDIALVNGQVNGLRKATSDSEAVPLQQLNEQLKTKQDTLVSGTNIKTINDNSLLGAGDIKIEMPAIYLEGEIKWMRSNISQMPAGWKEIGNPNNLLMSGAEFLQKEKFYIKVDSSASGQRLEFDYSSSSFFITYFNNDNEGKILIEFNYNYKMWIYDPENKYSDLAHIVYEKEDELWKNFSHTRKQHELEAKNHVD